VTLPDDGRRYEILDGELAVGPSPTSAHQMVSQSLELALLTWVRARGLGRIWQAPLDVILEPSVIVQPDIFFITTARSSTSPSAVWKAHQSRHRDPLGIGADADEVNASTPPRRRPLRRRRRLADLRSTHFVQGLRAVATYSGNGGAARRT
jgi:hypothetical protein